MRNRLIGIATLLISFSFVSKAGTADVTSLQSISLAQNATIEFGFNVASFAHNSGTYNPYPTSLNFQILGLTSALQSSSTLSGSSQQYNPQFLLDATLTSADGSAAVPLIESVATRLGLQAGSMVITPGVLQGAQVTSLNMINAAVQLSPQESSLIFGSNISSASDIAYIVLHNDGPAILLGLGAGYDLRSALVVSGVSGASPISTGGVTTQVKFIGATAAPEPGTYANLAAASLLLLAFNFYRSKGSKPASV